MEKKYEWSSSVACSQLRCSLTTLQEKSDVFERGHMPDMLLQSPGLAFTTTKSTMAISTNHGISHAIEEKTIQNDVDSRCRQIRDRKEVRQKRDPRAVRRNESDRRKNLTKNATRCRLSD